MKDCDCMVGDQNVLVGDNKNQSYTVESNGALFHNMYECDDCTLKTELCHRFRSDTELPLKETPSWKKLQEMRLSQS